MQLPFYLLRMLGTCSQYMTVMTKKSGDFALSQTIMIIAYLPGKLNMRVDLDPRNFEEFRKLKDVNQQLNQQLKGVY